MIGIIVLIANTIILSVNIAVYAGICHENKKPVIILHDVVNHDEENNNNNNN